MLERRAVRVGVHINRPKIHRDTKSLGFNVTKWQLKNLINLKLA